MPEQKEDTNSTKVKGNDTHYRVPFTALQAAIILVAMAGEKNIWRLKF